MQDSKLRGQQEQKAITGTAAHSTCRHRYFADGGLLDSQATDSQVIQSLTPYSGEEGIATTQKGKARREYDPEHRNGGSLQKGIPAKRARTSTESSDSQSGHQQSTICLCPNSEAVHQLSEAVQEQRSLLILLEEQNGRLSKKVADLEARGQVNRSGV